MSHLDDLYAAMVSADSDHGKTRTRLAFWKAVRTELCEAFGRFDEADRDDLAQNGMLLLTEKLARFDPQGPDAMLRWVRATAKRLGLAWERIPRERRALLDRYRRDLAPSPFARLVSLVWLCEGQDWLDEMIPQLSSPERRMLMHMIEDDDDLLFAEREGIEPGTVRSRRTRFLAKLGAAATS